MTDNLHVVIQREPGWPPHGQIWDGNLYLRPISAACYTDEQVISIGEQDICRMRAIRELEAEGIDISEEVWRLPYD